MWNYLKGYIARIICSAANMLQLHEFYIGLSFVKIFLSQPNVDVNTLITVKNCGPKVRTLLSIAVRNRDEALIDYLVALGAEINVHPSNWHIPLIDAIILNNLPIVQKLRLLGADINVQFGERGWSPLLTALVNRSFEIAEYLIKKGANVNAKIFYRKYTSVLLFAVSECPKNIVELLLDHNADIKARTLDGETALSIATQHSQIEIITLLINRGADISYRRSDNGTILYDLVHCLNFLYENNDKLEPWLETFENLLSLDEPTTDINVTKNDGKSLLHYSLVWGTDELIGLLLDAGVDINAVTEENILAIDICQNWAENSIDNSVVKNHIVKLISAGLDVCEKNKQAVELGFENLEIECLIEVEKMKINRVVESSISFLDVLSKSVHHLSSRLKFAGLDKVIDKKMLQSEYPLYGRMLYYKLFKVHRRIGYLKKLEETVEEVLCSVGLPYDILKHLWIYLCNFELKKCCDTQNYELLTKIIR